MTKILHAKVEAGEKLLASDILDLTFFPMGSILMMDGGWADGRGGWYICDGRNTPHGKTPDLKDRFIRGGTSSGASGGSNDSLSITLSEANLPSHKHSITDSGHTHNQNPHTHSQQPHSHTQNPHNHAQDSHSHPASYSGTRVQLGNDNGIAYASYAPGNGFSTATMAVTVSGTTATNQAATAANQNTSATNNDATAVNQSAYTGITETGTVGQNPPVPITVNVEPAYYTVIYIKKMA